jgi:hypothetical protein
VDTDEEEYERNIWAPPTHQRGERSAV